MAAVIGNNSGALSLFLLFSSLEWLQQKGKEEGKGEIRCPPSGSMNAKAVCKVPMSLGKVIPTPGAWVMGFTQQNVVLSHRTADLSAIAYYKLPLKVFSVEAVLLCGIEWDCLNVYVHVWILCVHEHAWFCIMNACAYFWQRKIWRKWKNIYWSIARKAN